MIAVFKGIQGRKTAFIRTPKVNKENMYDPYIKKQRLSKYIPELLLFIFFTISTGTGIYFLDFGFLIYHALMAMGFGYIFYRASIE